MRHWHGRWTNLHGTELTLWVNDEGQVRGSMHLHDAELRLEPFPVSGYVRGDVIGFAVDFGPLGHVTSWSGRVLRDVHGKPQLGPLTYVVAGADGCELYGPTHWNRVEPLTAATSAA